MSEIEQIAAGLSEAQKRYLRAVGDAGEPYEPRHGVTANWALRHGYAAMLWRRIEDGQAVTWEGLTGDGRRQAEALGCALTPLGEAVRAHLQGGSRKND